MTARPAFPKKKPKKEITEEQRAVQTAKRDGRRKVAVDKKAAAAAVQHRAAVTDNEAMVAKATPQGLLLLGFRRGEHGLLDSLPTTSGVAAHLHNAIDARVPFPTRSDRVPLLHVASGLLAGSECTRAGLPVDASHDLNATPVPAQSTGTQRKRPREIPMGNFSDAHNLFDDTSPDANA